MKKRWLGILVLVLLSLVFISCGKKEWVKDGYAHLAEQEYEKAIKAFEKSIDKEQETGEAYLGIATAWYEQEDYEKALASFEKARVQEAALSATAYNLMAVCERKTEDLQGAINYYSLGLSQTDISGELKQEMKKGLITAYEESGDRASALMYLQEYVSEFPEDTEAQKELDFLQTR